MLSCNPPVREQLIGVQMNTDQSQKLCYGIKEASTAINLSRALLFQKISSGELKSFRVGTRRLIHADDLTKFIDSYRSANTSAA
jgi:excisionase family DNA binding protein